MQLILLITSKRVFLVFKILVKWYDLLRKYTLVFNRIQLLNNIYNIGINITFHN
jgi:hypothetical protein